VATWDEPGDRRLASVLVIADQDVVLASGDLSFSALLKGWVSR
jgi:hypothetical protein